MAKTTQKQMKQVQSGKNRIYLTVWVQFTRIGFGNRGAVRLARFSTQKSAEISRGIKNDKGKNKV